jgi:hypothetical protein
MAALDVLVAAPVTFARRAVPGPCPALALSYVDALTRLRRSRPELGLLITSRRRSCSTRLSTAR